MPMQRNLPEGSTSGSMSLLRILAALFIALAFAGHGAAQAPAADTAAAPQMSAEDLSNLVGRIALYPDDLVAVVLPASTFPLQIVQADRWLEKRKSDPKLPIDDKWDDSVKTLANYPDVVKMMSGDLDWTSALGEAVVSDQSGVMEAIQAFRRRAQSAGNLKSDDKQVVTVEKEIVTIVPSNPEVIYVPQYNPTTVVVAGAPAWGYWPTPYPSYYYPYAPGAAFATGLVWGAAIGAAWGGARWGTNWGGNDININRNTNINTGDINRGNINRGQAGQLPANRGQGGNQSWKSDKRPGQVSGATGRGNTTGRVGDAGRGGSGGFGGAGGSRPSASTSGLGGGAGAGGARTGTSQAGGFGGGGGAGAAQRAGTASASPRDSFGGGSRGGTQGGGFSGYGSGRQTSMDSSRGAASRSSMSGSSMSRGGGGSMSRGGGGGGGRGGGGRGGGGRR
jgi:hypothetical protein